VQALHAEASQALDIQHRNHSIRHLDQPGSFQRVQSLIDPLPRRTNEMAEFFV